MKILLLYLVSCASAYTLFLIYWYLLAGFRSPQDGGWNLGTGVARAILDAMGWLIVCRQDASIHIYERATRNRLTPEEGLRVGIEGFDVNAIAFAYCRGRRILAASGGFRDILIYDISRPDQVRRAPLRTVQGTASVGALAFSSDGSVLFYGDDDGHFHRWSWDEGSEPITLHAPITPSRIHTVCSSADSAHVVSIDGAAAAVWEPTTNKFVRAIEHTGATCGAFSSTGSLLAVGGTHDVSTWDMSEVARQQTARYPGTMDVSFSPDGSMLLVTGEAGVRVLNAGTGQPLSAMFDYGAFAAAFINNNTILTLKHGGDVGIQAVADVATTLPTVQPGVNTLDQVSFGPPASISPPDPVRVEPRPAVKHVAPTKRRRALRLHFLALAAAVVVGAVPVALFLFLSQPAMTNHAMPIPGPRPANTRNTSRPAQNLRPPSRTNHRSAAHVEHGGTTGTTSSLTQTHRRKQTLRKKSVGRKRGKTNRRAGKRKHIPPSAHDLAR